MTNNIGAGGKNKSRGGRKTKKKGTRKKGGFIFFGKSAEEKFDDALHRYNAAGEKMKPTIRDELDRYAKQIEKTNPDRARLYRSSIPIQGGRTKRRTNNKRKTAKKNNKKKTINIYPQLSHNTS